MKEDKSFRDLVSKSNIKSKEKFDNFETHKNFKKKIAKK